MQNTQDQAQVGGYNGYKNRYVYFVGFAAALAGLLFGFDTGIISGALTFIQQKYYLSNQMEGIVVSAVLIGALFGTFMSNYISANYGRKHALVLSGILFCIGALASGIAPSPVWLIAARFFLGIAIGIASYATPLYLSEVSPENIRGRIVGLYQFMITFGLLMSYLTDMAFTPTGQWRLMLGAPVIPAIIMLLAVIFLPQSPRWFVLKGRIDDARNTLKKILPVHQVETTITNITEIVKSDLGKKKISNWKILSDSRLRAILLLGIIAQVVQQWTGINAVIYYAPIIFKTVGFATPMKAIIGTIAVGTVNMLATIITLKYVDRWGRKPILYAGLFIMLIGLITLGFIAKNAEIHPSFQYIALFSVLAYIVGFAISLGPIIWILCSEIYPIAARDFGIMCSTAANWFSNALLAMIFPSLIAWFASNTFYIFALTSVLGIIFVKFFVPETKGVSLEQIEVNLMSGKKLRHLGEL
jgi:SP family galactose:H+ symporter-like MFS transporter